MKVRAISTFVDWGWTAGCWGKVGVYRTFDYMKQTGITDLYWRVFNGGRAMYPSKIAQVQDIQAYKDAEKINLYSQANMSMEWQRFTDFNTYNPIPDAIKAAKEFGVNLHFWYSIYEDDHGGYVLSKFAKEHPEYWQMDREGNTYRGTLDWFFPEVRKYKLAIIDELLKYKANGLMLDFVRHNGCPSSDKNGIHRFGYNPEIREHYKKTYGKDPIDLPPDEKQWLSFKREIQTSLVKEIRKKMDRKNTYNELSLMLWPVDYAKWACLDVPQLTREGIVDMLSGFSIKYTFEPQEAVNMHRILKSQSKNKKVKIISGISTSDNGISADHFNNYVETAEKAGVDEIMLHESDSIVRYNLGPTIRAINAGDPNYKRVLKATRVDETDPDKIPWKKVRAYTDFLYKAGDKTDQVPSEKTAVRLAYNKKELILKFTCYDSHMDIALSPVPENPHNQYYLDALGPRTNWYYVNSFNIFLDSDHSHIDFYHFGTSPNNERTQETYVLSDWSGKWSSSVNAKKNRWEGYIRIPFATLGKKTPVPEEIWGVNIMRGIRYADETVTWSQTFWQLPFPDDMPHLKFLG